MKWGHHRRCPLTQVHRLARRLWSPLTRLVASRGDRGSPVSAPAQSDAIPRAHRSAPRCPRPYDCGYHTWRSQVRILRGEWYRGERVSHQAREDAYGEGRIHRRSEWIPRKDDGLTLDEWQKRLPRVSSTALWMTYLSCTIR